MNQLDCATSRPWLPYAFLFFIVYSFKATILFLGWAFKDQSPWIGHMMVDIWSWLDFFTRTDRGEIPFVDFAKEYPVGMGYFYQLIGKLAGRRDFAASFLFVHACVMSVIDVLNAILFFHILRKLKVRRAFFFALLFSLNLTILLLSPVRHEAIVTTTLLVAILMMLDGQQMWATISLGVGASLKWYPGVYFAILFFARIWKKEWREAFKTAGIFTCVFCAIQLPSIALSLWRYGNIDAWWGTYWFHIHRPLYWDTPLGVLTLFFGEVPFERFYSLLSMLAMIFFMIFPRGLDWKKKVILVCISALVFNRVYSTQFHLWFYPILLLIAALEKTSEAAYDWLAYFFILDALNVLIYPFAFTFALKEIGDFAPYKAYASHGPWIWIFSIAIALRAFVLLGLAWNLLVFREKVASNAGIAVGGLGEKLTV